MTTEPIEYVNVSNKLSQVRDLNAPPLDELLPILSHGIQKDFAETSVEIVECPGKLLILCQARSTIASQIYRVNRSILLDAE